MATIIDEAADQIANAIGAGTPEQQIVGAIVLGGGIILTSSIGLVGTLILAPLAFLFAAIGFLRLFPAVEERWPLS
ncbi:hypothetical protein ACFQGT_00445 [Natrialbaceae archaeon GCM10025810]